MASNLCIYITPGLLLMLAESTRHVIHNPITHFSFFSSSYSSLHLAFPDKYRCHIYFLYLKFSVSCMRLLGWGIWLRLLVHWTKLWLTSSCPKTRKSTFIIIITISKRNLSHRHDAPLAMDSNETPWSKASLVSALLEKERTRTRTNVAVDLQ